MRIEVEAKKLADKEEMPEIQEWNAALDAKLEKADDEVRSVREWLDEKKKEADVQAQEEKFQFEEKLHKTKLELQNQLQSVATQGQRAITPRPND